MSSLIRVCMHPVLSRQQNMVQTRRTSYSPGRRFCSKTIHSGDELFVASSPVSVLAPHRYQPPPPPVEDAPANLALQVFGFVIGFVLVSIAIIGPSAIQESVVAWVGGPSLPLPETPVNFYDSFWWLSLFKYWPRVA